MAEGIETQAELATLQLLGVAAGQGYLIAKPGPLPLKAVGGWPRKSVTLMAASESSRVTERAPAEVEANPELERLVRPLLAAVVELTGLESSYLTVLHPRTGQLEHRYVRNSTDLEVPEPFTIPWTDSLCAVYREHQLLWTDDALEVSPMGSTARPTGSRPS